MISCIYKFATRIFFKLMIYQIIFLNVYLKFQNLQKSSMELKDKYYLNANHFNLKVSLMDELLRKPEMINNCILYIEIIAAILAVFGLRFGARLSALIFTLLTVLNHNPLLPQNKANTFLGLKFELILNIGVLIVILADAFRPCNVIISEEKKSRETPNESSSSEKKSKKKRIHNS